MGRSPTKQPFLFRVYQIFWYRSKVDEIVKSQNLALSVIPAKAGIQSRQGGMDPGWSLSRI